MKKDKAIPQGYMTVGEAAKKMGVTVRTMQYYHKEGLLTPSSESTGGRRLYTDKDVIKLYQLLSMKHLGFSLNDIKNHLISLDTPADIAHALTEQASTIREKIETLSESLKEIEALKGEVLQMQQVDFTKYADIIVNLQMKNEHYRLIKHFDDTTLDHFRSRFDKNSALTIMETVTHMNEEALRLHTEGVAPESEKGQHFAKEFWDMVMEFTGGDMRMLPKLMEAGRFNPPDKKWNALSSAFIEPALGAYFTALGYNPFEEEKE